MELLSKIAKNATMCHAWNANRNISRRIMEQHAPYVQVLWQDAESVITLCSAQDVMMVTLWNKIEMEPYSYPMETVSFVILIVLLAIKRQPTVQAVKANIHWVQEELVSHQTNLILLYYWILIWTSSLLK